MPFSNFPFKNPYKDVEEYGIFIDEKISILNLQAESLSKQKDNSFPIPSEIIDFPKMKFSNLVISTDTNKRSEIDIQAIFKQFQFSENEVFIRYQDQIKNNYFR